MSRYLVGLHTRFNWIYGAFKDVPGEDAERLLHWLPGAVARGEVEVPERWLPERAEGGVSADPAMAVLERQYRELAATLEAHRNSLSWRITAPFRAGAALTRRRRTAREEGTNEPG